ncbi:MAG: bis(5'-nucleosyl)-tetraphosphatase (symmetrical) YqeK [Firmicutes bacterium]|nr:bis(5'-nucleosyl)-tetraphosphatase (symmetrical) YqeK [Bacillota bacterium]
MVLEERFRQLTAHRQAHIERVMVVMEALAEAHQLDRQEARLAGWGHDLAREWARPQLLDEARRLGLRWGPWEEQEPLLLHGPVAAAWLQRAGVGTPEVWEAIHYHTTAGPSLGKLARALFVADGVEPGRQYPERETLYQQALRDLDAGYCAVLASTLRYLQTRNLAPHPDMLAAWAQCQARDP